MVNVKICYSVTIKCEKVVFPVIYMYELTYKCKWLSKTSITRLNLLFRQAYKKAQISECLPNTNLTIDKSNK